VALRPGSLSRPADLTRAPGDIRGDVWFDRNRNRWQDYGEPGRVGVTVTVRHLASGGRYTAQTDAEGYFRIFNLPLGDYEVTAPDAGYDSVTPPRWEITIVDDRPRGVRFPQQGGRVYGRAWDDINKDGLRGTWEPRHKIQFVLFGPSDHEGEIRRSFDTDEDGEYRFEDLPSGTYQVRVSSPPGMVATIPHAGEWYLDSDLIGTEMPTSEPLNLWAAWFEANVDVGFVVRSS
jgi:hypothetical protein